MVRTVTDDTQTGCKTAASTNGDETKILALLAPVRVRVRVLVLALALVSFLVTSLLKIPRAVNNNYTVRCGAVPCSKKPPPYRFARHPTAHPPPFLPLWLFLTIARKLGTLFVAPTMAMEFVETLDVNERCETKLNE